MVISLVTETDYDSSFTAFLNLQDTKYTKKLPLSTMYVTMSSSTITKIIQISTMYCMFIHVDINECWNPCACPVGQKCHNLVGSYECKQEGKCKKISKFRSFLKFLQLHLKYNCFIFSLLSPTLIPIYKTCFY